MILTVKEDEVQKGSERGIEQKYMPTSQFVITPKRSKSKNFRQNER